MKPTSVVLIEDSPIFLGLVTAFLEHNHAGMTSIAGAARTGPDGLQLVQALRPDAAIVDLRLPGMPGLEVVRQLRANDTRLAIVVLSSADPDAFRADALAAGADAFVSKDSLLTDFLPALGMAVRARTTPLPHGGPIDA